MAKPARAAALLGALLWWTMVALMLVRALGTEAVRSAGGAALTRAVSWRPAPGWAGVAFFGLVTAAVLAPAGVAWLAARGRRRAVGAVGLAVLALSVVAFIATSMPAAGCWLAAGIWPRPGVRLRAWRLAQAVAAMALVAWSLGVAALLILAP